GARGPAGSGRLTDERCAWCRLLRSGRQAFRPYDTKSPRRPRFMIFPRLERSRSGGRRPPARSDSAAPVGNDSEVMDGVSTTLNRIPGTGGLRYTACTPWRSRGMKRRWNAPLWAGFLVVLAAPVTYLTVFVRFPVTRDFPWATLLIFCAGLALIGFGLRRAFREPQIYRGKISGSIVMTAGVALFGLFLVSLFYHMRQ